MSIQSTITLTRQEAEERLVYRLEKERRKFIEAEVHTMSDEAIENALDETFNNYSIEEN